MSILLKGTSQKLRIVTGQAATIHCSLSGFDVDSSVTNANDRVTTYTSDMAAISSATEVDLAVAPANSTTTRRIESIYIRNAHATVSCDITIKRTDGTNSPEVIKVTVGPGETLEYNGKRWEVYGPFGEPREVEEDTYSFNSGGVAVTTSKLMWDMFNASGSGKVVRIFQIEAYVRNSAAVTGVGITLEVKRTTAVGTGGSTITADEADNLQPSLPSQITFRSAPTGGATATGNPLAVGNIYTEETVNAQPQIPMYENGGEGLRQRITLREGEGLRLDTGPLGAAGTVAFRVAFSVTPV